MINRPRRLTNVNNDIYSTVEFMEYNIFDIKSFHHLKHANDIFNSIRLNTDRAYFGMNTNKEIICVSKYWEKICGFTQEEIVGLKPVFLQGKETNLEDIKRFEKTLMFDGFSESIVVNYTKKQNKILE